MKHQLLSRLLHQSAGRLVCALALTGLLTVNSFAAEPPKAPPVGEKAPEFSLKTLDDKTVKLSSLTAEQPVVLLMLRGWPGYQCPICTTQVREFSKSADAFAAKKVRVVMVYPGPADQLKEHAEEFLKDKTWPKDFIFLTDPDYAFTKAYGLRWDAPRETAYPSTFVIDRDGKVRFVKVSTTHGDRADVPTVLKALEGLK
jgi:thioredoxin-dependent peroxiredoxin